nr:PREDICTED: FH2 domain-containing protein 1 [Anolis carolinensis]|eukprot:XP_008121821.2 PREDICTED: FH2 domain-containing protein 1 [Anolis carolinensis]
MSAAPSPAGSWPPSAPPLPSGVLRGGGGLPLRRFHWEPLPAERVRGRRNLWTGGGGGGPGEPPPLDLALLEELFAQRGGHEERGGRGGLPAPQVSLLEPKKALNLSIFLKQFKRPPAEMVAALQEGDGACFGAERLLELSKMLPDPEEVKRLLAFQGDHNRLLEPELFALLLVQVPSFALRLQILLLREEFFPQLSSLRSAIQTLTDAATEILNCEELHSVIRLVLRAGNYMNQGGYAGSALGFRVPSLLRLTDTKANRPGMDLLHFVALEAERKEPALLCFPTKLPHVGPASRIVEGEVLAELRGLGVRLQGARGHLGGLGWEGRLGPFLEGAEAELRSAWASWEEMHRAQAALADFLCEEPLGFSLPDSCAVFQAFAERFLAAVQENRAREAALRRSQQQRVGKSKRRSIATCSSRDPGLESVQLDALLLGGALHPRDRPHGGASLQGGHSFEGLSFGEGSPSQSLNRRHTLASLPSPGDPQRPLTRVAEGPGTPVVTPTRQEGGKQAPSCTPPPGSPGGFRLSSLFSSASKKPASPQDSPIDPGTPVVAPTKKKGSKQAREGLGEASLRTRAPSRSPPLPGSLGGFRLSSLFPSASRKPTSPQDPLNDVSALVGFFRRRLSLGEKPRRPPQN